MPANSSSTTVLEKPRIQIKVTTLHPPRRTRTPLTMDGQDVDYGYDVDAGGRR